MDNNTIYQILNIVQTLSMADPEAFPFVATSITLVEWIFGITSQDKNYKQIFDALHAAVDQIENFQKIDAFSNLQVTLKAQIEWIDESIHRLADATDDQTRLDTLSDFIFTLEKIIDDPLSSRSYFSIIQDIINDPDLQEGDPYKDYPAYQLAQAKFGLAVACVSALITALGQKIKLQRSAAHYINELKMTPTDKQFPNTNDEETYIDLLIKVNTYVSLLEVKTTTQADLANKTPHSLLLNVWARRFPMFKSYPDGGTSWATVYVSTQEFAGFGSHEAMVAARDNHLSAAGCLVWGADGSQPTSSYLTLCEVLPSEDNITWQGIPFIRSQPLLQQIGRGEKTGWNVEWLRKVDTGNPEGKIDMQAYTFCLKGDLELGAVPGIRSIPAEDLYFTQAPDYSITPYGPIPTGGKHPEEHRSHRDKSAAINALYQQIETVFQTVASNFEYKDSNGDRIIPKWKDMLNLYASCYHMAPPTISVTIDWSSSSTAEASTQWSQPNAAVSYGISYYRKGNQDRQESTITWSKWASTNNKCNPVISKITVDFPIITQICYIYRQFTNLPAEQRPKPEDVHQPRTIGYCLKDNDSGLFPTTFQDNVSAPLQQAPVLEMLQCVELSEKPIVVTHNTSQTISRPVKGPKNQNVGDSSSSLSSEARHQVADNNTAEQSTSFLESALNILGITHSNTSQPTNSRPPETSGTKSNKAKEPIPIDFQPSPSEGSKNQSSGESSSSQSSPDHHKVVHNSSSEHKASDIKKDSSKHDKAEKHSHKVFQPDQLLVEKSRGRSSTEEAGTSSSKPAPHTVIPNPISEHSTHEVKETVAKQDKADKHSHTTSQTASTPFWKPQGHTSQEASSSSSLHEHHEATHSSSSSSEHTASEIKKTSAGEDKAEKSSHHTSAPTQAPFWKPKSPTPEEAKSSSSTHEHQKGGHSSESKHKASEPKTHKKVG